MNNLSKKQKIKRKINKPLFLNILMFGQTIFVARVNKLQY